MDELKNNKTEKRNSVREKIRYTIAFSSGIILLILLYFVIAYYRLTPDKLYTENIVTYNYDDHAEFDTVQIADMAAAYSEEKFGDIPPMTENRRLGVFELFVVGLSYLQTGELSKAIADFQVVITEAEKANASSLKQDAEYYLAMANLKNRDYDQAIELMIKIHDDKTNIHKGDVTRSLIRKIKMLKWK